MSAHRTDRWQRLSLASEALRGNPLGDPSERPVWVWSPADTSRRYPSVYVLQAMFGIVDGWFNTEPWGESYPEAIERMEPQAIVVLVDGFTALGGSQFLDSPAIGRYHTYLCDEVVPFVDERFPTLPGAAHRGLQGKSSGGFGAMVSPLLRPDLFGALATHAGDVAFDLVYPPELGLAARILRNRYDGSYDAFWSDFRSGRRVLDNRDDPLLAGVYALSAAYSSDPDGRVVLPFDPETGEVVPDVFERWRAWDPLRLSATPRHAETLRGLRGIWVDAGRDDEYLLDLGATAYRRLLGEIEVPAEQVHFELFPGGHRGTTWRCPLALAWLLERLG